MIWQYKAFLIGSLMTAVGAITVLVSLWMLPGRHR
jgi:hypothetical protein